MLHKLVLWLLGRLVRERVRARSDRRPTTGRGPTHPPPSARPVAPTDRSRRLVGPPMPHDRIVLVPRDRVAILLEAGQSVRVAGPRTYLWPPIVPSRRPITVLTVNTAPQRLMLTVVDAVTLDGYAVPRLEIDVTVQVDTSDGGACLTRLAAEAGEELERRLLDRLERELREHVERVVGAHRLDALRRVPLAELLSRSTLPSRMAGGTLVLRTAEVTAALWPGADPGTGAGPTPAAAADEPPAMRTTGTSTTGTRSTATSTSATSAGVPSARTTNTEATSAAADAAASAGTSAGGGDSTALRLSRSAKLAELWSAYASTELDGIVGARAGSTSTVIAVPRQLPSTPATFAVREALRRELGRSTRVVILPGGSYEQLVAGWFAAVDPGTAELVAVWATGTRELQVVVDRARPAADGGDLDLGTPADRQALRDLLPHQRVRFLPADHAALLVERRR